ncbi:Ferrochelatase [Enhygromyxa salina]|uniref:Ferrochelatase n=1 Tax=Enhygromyxa salina TaxID=215803 RepID=A0A2S9Y7V2_9BACT|nr:ferrochelatase [Enhygromyxa salina]PRQ01101.1 Ferrochelatase [Enhygromyxa salina]
MSAPLHRTGILLVNVGTPEAPEPGPVRRYLREFLSDPRVIDINPVGRWLLLNLIILPTRPKKSAAAYRQIWTDAGSPLLVHGQALVAALGQRIAEHPIELAMRYGSPSIEAALTRLRERSCDHIVLVPLYPHYASSSTGSALDKVYGTVAKLWNTPFITVVPPFYDHPAFISAFTAVGRPRLDALAPDHVLFSFHGLPERQVIASADPQLCVAKPDCCERLVDGNRNCYRAQCFATARALAASLELGAEHGIEQRWSISFQSRLGRTPWIKPYTDQVIPALAGRGVRKLAVFCPAFVADCLETLEEIGVRARADFVAAGGETLELIPSLNAEPAWVGALEQLVRERLPSRL